MEDKIRVMMNLGDYVKDQEQRLQHKQDEIDFIVREKNQKELDYNYQVRLNKQKESDILQLED